MSLLESCACVSQPRPPQASCTRSGFLDARSPWVTEKRRFQAYRVEGLVVGGAPFLCTLGLWPVPCGLDSGLEASVMWRLALA